MHVENYFLKLAAGGEKEGVLLKYCLDIANIRVGFEYQVHHGLLAQTS